jgi:hypothetical protein
MESEKDNSSNPLVLVPQRPKGVSPLKRSNTTKDKVAHVNDSGAIPVEKKSFTKIHSARTLLKKVVIEEGDEIDAINANENGNDMRLPKSTIETSTSKEKQSSALSSSSSSSSSTDDDGTASSTHFPAVAHQQPKADATKGSRENSIERERDPQQPSKKITSLFGRGKSKRPDHMKLALWWRVDLLEKNTTEERLSIKLHRPHTARQQLGIDIYEARGIFKTLQIRTVEGLAL